SSFLPPWPATAASPPTQTSLGIGVRAAIYTQNLTCFLPVIVHLWDRKISRDELKGIKDQSIGMLAVAFAILFTTIILAKGAGGNQTITSYHAAVVLDLSWMNNTSTWIWFILYAHHRSKRDDQPTGANWSDWRKALLELSGSCWGGLREPAPARRNLMSSNALGASPSASGALPSASGASSNASGTLSPRSPSLLLGSIHLSLMAAVGIWLWSDPSKFGQPLDAGCDPTLTVVGVPARFSIEAVAHCFIGNVFPSSHPWPQPHSSPSPSSSLVISHTIGLGNGTNRSRNGATRLSSPFRTSSGPRTRYHHQPPTLPFSSSA
ncbi:hypothetical protein B0H14DRAFT_69509, partial [Mycena olivaceomarginata]